jgi:hypothetical protein
MSINNELPEKRGDFLSDRLFDLTRRIKGIDPQLTRALVPWVMRHRRYLPGFMRLARTVAQSARVRARSLFLFSALRQNAICDAAAAMPGRWER